MFPTRLHISIVCRINRDFASVQGVEITPASVEILAARSTTGWPLRIQWAYPDALFMYYGWRTQ